MLRNRSRLCARHVVLALVGTLVGVTAGCSSSDGSDAIGARPTIVVSNVVLGAVTSEIAGPDAEVVVLVPNGVDPHLYEPSAKDIERLNSADLVVVNGLGLETRLEESLDRVRAQRIPIFRATDHIHAMDTESAAGDDGAAHRHSEDDPHFWTDPRLMASVVEDLGRAVSDLGLDIGDRAVMLSERLLTFDQEMLARVASLPPERRVLVTGHESLGYFAERYGFDIVGTIIPGLTSGAEVSAGNLAEVKAAVENAGVGVIFTELGTPSASASVLSDELGVKVVEISTHLIPDEALEDGLNGAAYMKFIAALVDAVVTALAQ